MSTPPQQPEEPAEKPVQEPAEGQAPPPSPTPEAQLQSPTQAEDQAEPKPESHALRNVALIVAGLFVAIVAGFLIGRNGQESPTGQVSATQAVATPSPSQASPSPSAAPSPSPRPSPSPSPTSTTLVDIQGAGSGTSGSFNAPNPWKLTYNFECPEGGPPGLAVDLYQGDTLVKEVVNDARSSGDGTMLVNLGGSNLTLRIRTLDCKWRLTATT